MNVKLGRKAGFRFYISKLSCVKPIHAQNLNQNCTNFETLKRFPVLQVSRTIHEGGRSNKTGPGTTGQEGEVQN